MLVNENQRPSGEYRTSFSSNGVSKTTAGGREPSIDAIQISLPPVDTRCVYKSHFPSGETSSGSWNVPLAGTGDVSRPVARSFRKI